MQKELITYNIGSQNKYTYLFGYSDVGINVTIIQSPTFTWYGYTVRMNSQIRLFSVTIFGSTKCKFQN